MIIIIIMIIIIMIIIIIMKIIITLFESQIILAEHECCTNWGDCKSNKSNQIKSNQKSSAKRMSALFLETNLNLNGVISTKFKHSNLSFILIPHLDSLLSDSVKKIQI